MTLQELEAVLSHVIDMQMPKPEELPEGTSSTDWIERQNFVRGQISVEGRVTGFSSTGLPVLLEFAKGIRASNPEYAGSTSPNSFATQIVTLLVQLKRERAKGPVQSSELAALQDGLAKWFASVSQVRKHLIPCTILPAAAATFFVGPVQFLHASMFDPKTFGMSAELAQTFLEPLFRSMNDRAAVWLAIVEVGGCEPSRSEELADISVDVALAALQLVIPPQHSAKMARITGRTMPPFTASLVYSAGEISCPSANHQPGRALAPEAFDQFVVAAHGPLSSAGMRIDTLLSDGGPLERLETAWCDAAFWFHEALAEPLSTVAIAKLETSVENLFAASNPTLSTSRILLALKGVFGLCEDDPIVAGSLTTVKSFVTSVVTARSRILHGTWSTLTDEVPLNRNDVALLARQLLLSYTLMLDQYKISKNPVDKASDFLNWMEVQRTAPHTDAPDVASHPGSW